MSDETPPATPGHEGAGEGGHGEIHMPPNSWSPIALALAMTATFVGFLVGPWLWGLGLAGVVACLAVWFRSARTEYRELPD